MNHNNQSYIFRNRKKSRLSLAIHTAEQTYGRIDRRTDQRIDKQTKN